MFCCACSVLRGDREGRSLAHRVLVVLHERENPELRIRGPRGRIERRRIRNRRVPANGVNEPLFRSDGWKMSNDLLSVIESAPPFRSCVNVWYVIAVPAVTQGAPAVQRSENRTGNSIVVPLNMAPVRKWIAYRVGVQVVGDDDRLAVDRPRRPCAEVVREDGVVRRRVTVDVDVDLDDVLGRVRPRLRGLKGEHEIPAARERLNAVVDQVSRADVATRRRASCRPTRTSRRNRCAPFGFVRTTLLLVAPFLNAADVHAADGDVRDRRRHRVVRHAERDVVVRAVEGREVDQPGDVIELADVPPVVEPA